MFYLVTLTNDVSKETIRIMIVVIVAEYVSGYVYDQRCSDHRLPIFSFDMLYLKLHYPVSPRSHINCIWFEEDLASFCNKSRSHIEDPFRIHNCSGRCTIKRYCANHHYILHVICILFVSPDICILEELLSFIFRYGV